MRVGDLIKIESESEPGKFYEVNLAAHTCTCLHYVRKLHRLATGDPHRLCKHIVTAMADSNSFEGFEKLEDEIRWFAQKKSAYTNREKALNKKLYPLKKAPKEQLPLGSIETTMREITEEPSIGGTPFYLWCDPGIYYYIKGKGREDTIEAIIPEQAGVGLYSINGQRAREYYFGEPDTDETDIEKQNEGMTITVRFEAGPAPRQYKYLQEALFLWLEEEFRRPSLETKNKH